MDSLLTSQPSLILNSLTYTKNDEVSNLFLNIDSSYIWNQYWQIHQYTAFQINQYAEWSGPSLDSRSSNVSTGSWGCVTEWVIITFNPWLRLMSSLFSFNSDSLPVSFRLHFRIYNLSTLHLAWWLSASIP